MCLGRVAAAARRGWLRSWAMCLRTAAGAMARWRRGETWEDGVAECEKLTLGEERVMGVCGVLEI